MRSFFVLLLFVTVMLMGCAESMLTDISGWDLSVCARDSASFDACFDFFLDNQTKILGGKTAIETIMGGITGGQQP